MDLIERQAAIDEIGEWIKAFLEQGHRESAADACLIQDGIIQLPPAQPEQSDDADFWRKRADYYYNVSVKLIDKIQDGAKCDSVTIDENGITYKLQAPDKCDRCRFTFFEKGEDDDGQ